MQRVELSVHTKMSEMGSVISVKDLLNRAKAQGMLAVAVTDDNGVQVFPEFFREAKRSEIKPIFGAKIRHNDFAGQHIFKATVLVKNQVGIKNLYRMISALRIDGTSNKISFDELQEYREGLLIGSGGSDGMLYRAFAYNSDEKAINRIADFYDYLEIESISGNEEEQKVNRRIYELGEKLNKPVVAVSNARMLDKEDAVCLDILRFAGGLKLGKAHPYLRTTNELISEFSYLGEDAAQMVVCDNTLEIADQIENVTPIPEGFFPPRIDGVEKALRREVMQKAHKLYGDPLPGLVVERLRKELGWIDKNGSASLIIIAQKLVRNSKAHGYPTSPRGAVGTSLVAYFAGICEINPLVPHYRCPNCRHTEFFTDGSIKSGFDLPEKICPVCGEKLIGDGHDIPAEVLFGIDGENYPDIDLNFAAEYRSDAVTYLLSLFGKNRIAYGGYVSTVTAGKALHMFGNYFEGREEVPKEEEKKRIVDKLTGVKESDECYSGGLILVPEGNDIFDFTPVNVSDESPIPTTHFDFHILSGSLVKFDILDHNTLTRLKHLENLTAVSITEVPLNDKRVMSLFRSPEALGVTVEQIGYATGTLGLSEFCTPPNFSQPFVEEILTETKPKRFSDLVQISALSHGANAWNDNAETLIANGVCDLSDVIAARDDVMNSLVRKGMDERTAFGIMEIVRKGKARKELTEDLKSEMLSHGVPEWYVKSCQKIGYLFPKAHCVSYVINALRLGWYKIYYPFAFYKTYMKHVDGYAEKVLHEAVCRGIKLD